MNDIRDALHVARDSGGKLIRRPVSPHIGIYRWPITMVSSILNRATGIALSAGALLLIWWLVAAASGPQEWAEVQGFVASPVGLLMLLGWTASLFYHLFSGLRHLAWDAGYGFAKPSLGGVTWLVVGLTVLATVGVWVVGYLSMPGVQ
jgi:succinate dehydrogenase / fumarate reductase cytochrome b subunit